MSSPGYPRDWGNEEPDEKRIKRLEMEAKEYRRKIEELERTLKIVLSYRGDLDVDPRELEVVVERAVRDLNATGVAEEVIKYLNAKRLTRP